MAVMYQSSTLTVANGAALSDAIAILDARSGSLALPAALTSTALTFKLSADNSTFLVLKDSSGSDVSITVGTSRVVQIPAAVFAGAKWLKLQFGSNEAAERSIGIELKS